MSLNSSACGSHVVSHHHQQQQQQLIESPNTDLPAFTLSSGSIWSVWTSALGEPVYLLLPCHFLYQLKHTHAGVHARTHARTQPLMDPSARSTLQEADTASSQMFRRMEQCEIQDAAARTPRAPSSYSTDLIGWHRPEPGCQSHLHAC